MSNDIKVSIVVPIYNREKYLRQCVDSIVAQTLKEIEIILVDNGSIDRCPQICDEYAAEDSRIRIIHIESNVGVGKAYNTGMAEAKGEYIGFVESDDWIEPEMYEELYNKAVEQDVDVVKSLFTRVNGEEKNLTNQYGNRLFNQKLENLSVTAPEIIFGHVSAWSAIYRRSFIEEYKIQYPERSDASIQDLDFYWRVITRAQSFYLMPRSYYNYRVDNPDASTKQGYQSACNSVTGFRDTFKWLLENNTNPRFMELFYKEAFRVAKLTINNSWRCKGLNKIRHTKGIARIFAPHISRMQFTRFSQPEKKEFLCMLRHPVWYGLKQLTYKKESNPAHTIVKFLGIELYKKKKTAQCNTRKLLYLPIRKEIFDQQGSKVFYLGLPLVRTTEKGNLVKKHFLGIRYKTKQSPAKPAAPQSPAKPAAPQSPAKPAAPAPYIQDVSMLKAACYANAIADTHKQTFPKYKNSLRGQDIMVVACGPTANYAPIMPDIKHLAVNRAITMGKYHYDFCFMIDYPAIKEYISATFDYGCINFFGKYVYDPCRGLSIPDSLAELAHAERFYSEVPRTTNAYHDIEHFPLTDFGTIVHCALSFLLYTRPRRIYLVGCDTANTGYFEKNAYQKPMNINLFKTGYVKLKQIRDTYYPEVEIVSINPVGLKGMFHDVYTKSYLAEHPEIDSSTVEIINQ